MSPRGTTVDLEWNGPLGILLSLIPADLSGLAQVTFVSQGLECGWFFFGM